MIRKHENTDSWKAGALAIGVHVALLAAMLISFNWKAAHPVQNVTEVELWDKLPAPKTVDVPKPEPKPVIEEKPEPKPEPKPIVEEKPKPEEPKVDIALEKKKKELEQKQAEKEKLELLKKDKALEQKKQLEALQAATREDDLKDKQALKDKKAAEKANKDALKKLQQDSLSEEKGNDDKLASDANASLIGEYKSKIQAKIKANVNKTLCGDGSPEIKVEISVLPTGEIGGTPKITKSSGSDACDEAVERAIIASQPLPLPEDASLKAQFKHLNLKFRPND